ncbi:MAG: extracellular solute-binding protein [Spirochaetales bacterium]|nr:extracellular solute-binding protein [Spirochaetales bacterium]
MRKVFSMLLVVLILALFAVPLMAGGQKEAGKALSAETEAWLKAAKLGKYADSSFDEAALYEAAKKEGEVNVYSYSSRVFKFGKTFEAKYPGIKVNGFDIDSAEIVTKVLAEQDAKNYTADVIFLKDPATVVHELYERGMAFPYVPPDMKDKIPAEYRNPFVGHHASVNTFIYNNGKLSSPPFSSMWDLTKPEWKGRFIIPDPQKMPEFLEVLTTIVQHSKEMEAEYEKVFGKKIKLSDGVKNAGYEWILRILKNDVVVVGSTNDVSNAVGLSTQANPPVGFTAFSRLRDKKKNPNLQFTVMYDVKPIMGVSTEAIIAIINEAKHPNAAKLMIHWMLGDEKGGRGYSPYYVLGDFPLRSDVTPPPGAKKITELNLWASDPKYVWSTGQQVLEFWVSHLK